MTHLPRFSVLFALLALPGCANFDLPFPSDDAANAPVKTERHVPIDEETVENDDATSGLPGLLDLTPDDIAADVPPAPSSGVDFLPATANISAPAQPAVPPSAPVPIMPASPPTSPAETTETGLWPDLLDAVAAPPPKVEAVQETVKQEKNKDGSFAPIAFSNNEARASDHYDLTLKDGRHLQIKGIEVYLLDADGTPKEAPDGIYFSKDGKIIPAKNGKIRGLNN